MKLFRQPTQQEQTLIDYVDNFGTDNLCDWEYQQWQKLTQRYPYHTGMRKVRPTTVVLWLTIMLTSAILLTALLLMR
jgi:hypothetical protein